MPLYEYRCMECDQRTDRVLPHQQVKDPGPCTACGGVLQRQWSRVAVKLSGWGFGATDAMVPPRPGRGEFREVRDRAERLADDG